MVKYQRKVYHFSYLDNAIFQPSKIKHVEVERIDTVKDLLTIFGSFSTT